MKVTREQAAQWLGDAQRTTPYGVDQALHIAQAAADAAGGPMREVREEEALKGGRWTSSDDVERMARMLFRAMYPGGKPPVRCLLVDVVGEAERRLQAWSAAPETFQARVQPWMMECFGPAIAADRKERNHRFLEEALELVQACGCTASEAHQLVEYVFSRPVGERGQEVGGAMVTLAALCLAQRLDMHAEAERELDRINAPETIAKIRAKQAAKPKHSPLAEATEPAEPEGVTCLRCGFVTYVAEGESPGQTTHRMQLKRQEDAGLKMSGKTPAQWPDGSDYRGGD